MGQGLIGTYILATFGLLRQDMYFNEVIQEIHQVFPLLGHMVEFQLDLAWDPVNSVHFINQVV